ncbi:N-acetylmuramoyl-L-alanine amidase [Halobacillus massiliensis]|uniref:N-acetylmuramoyl-L-alanine amidase n=1 Tax=Halobacillus massiliensis TaxID=1926286 RepID=UPI0009E65E21|nr:N-acetylmuramoyl-L-alanine amidase [Halobacillus massiliensis]
MKTIVIDPGHGGSDSGAASQGDLEKDFNLSIAVKVRDFLIQNYEVHLVLTRSTDTSLSLTERTNLANAQNADFFLSIHNNAGGGSGFESYIFNGSVSSITRNHQHIIHDQIVSSAGSKYDIVDRGKKREDFHVLRESRMSALLLEVLFVDNDHDLSLLRNTSFINAISSAIARGVAQAFDLPTKLDSSGLFQVIAGSFKSRSNAEYRVQYLNRKNIHSCVVPISVSGFQYYRVQAGAFSNRQNAEQQVELLKAAGINDAYFIRETNTPAAPIPPPLTPVEKFSILGDSILKACQLDEFVKTINPDAPILGEYYIQYGKAYGLRGDIAYAQALHETNYFRFTGLVDKSQNNYAGIGATGPGCPGAVFASPELGVHAHIQHLYAYASSRSLPEGYSKVDPRFDLVTRGSAATWIQLNGKWAVPGTSYGQSILLLFRRNAVHAAEEMKEQINDINDLLKELE